MTEGGCLSADHLFQAAAARGTMSRRRAVMAPRVDAGSGRPVDGGFGDSRGRWGTSATAWQRGWIRMVVIARFPHLDSPGEAAAVETCADTPGAAVVEVAPARRMTPDVVSGTPIQKPPRPGRMTFPIRSTLVLAALAAGCWAAVWREERKRAAEDVASRSHAEDLALEAESPTGVNR